MEPYFQSPNVTIYHGNCLDIIPSIPQVDLLIADPPYGVKWQSNRRANVFAPIAGDESTEIGYDALRASVKRLKNHKHIYCFGPFDLKEITEGAMTQLIWDKELNGSGNLSSVWAPSFEPISFGVYSTAKRKSGTIDGGLSARMRRGSVLRYQRPNGSAVRHPTEKPVGLLRELIESSSRHGETIFDPFAGSGSTAVAAVMEGRKAIVIELEAKWCDLIASRVEKAEKIMRQLEV